MKKKQTPIIISRSPSFFSRKIDGKWILLEKNKQFVRELNETSSSIWELAKKPTSVNTIAKKISRLYQHPYDDVLKDVSLFVQDYLHEGFLVEVQQPTINPR